MATIIEVVSPFATIISGDFERMAQALEAAGRTCYKSEDRITDKSAEKFVRMICRNRHESVLEHESVTVRITCSRACSHQLVRHRLGAYSQESQRYCNYGKKHALRVIAPPSVKVIPGEYGDRCINPWVVAMLQAYDAYIQGLLSGLPPEDARYVLPNATATEIVVTYNLRQWRHVFKTRACDPHAQWEIRAIMGDLLDSFKRQLPCVFSDLTRA